MARSLKYGYINIKGFGREEPIFILRPGDRFALRELTHYWYTCQHQGAPWAHIDGVAAVIEAFRNWRATHPTKIPDSPPIIVQDDPDGEPAPPPDEPDELPDEPKEEDEPLKVAAES